MHFHGLQIYTIFADFMRGHSYFLFYNIIVLDRIDLYCKTLLVSTEEMSAHARKEEHIDASTLFHSSILSCP